MIGLHRYTFPLFVVTVFALLLLSTQQAIGDNLSLANCVHRFARGDFSAPCRSSQSVLLQGHRALQDTIDTMSLWTSGDFQQLAQRCMGGSLCGCFSVDVQQYEPVLYDQIDAYYAAISHKIAYGEFPVLDACKEQFVSSSLLANKTEIYKSHGNGDLEWLHRELAYLIDRDWGDMRQRGTIAYWQGIKYFADSLFEEAEQAFLIASTSFADSTNPAFISAEAHSLALLGKARFSQNNLDGAVEAYRQSILTSPKEAAQGRVDVFFELLLIWLGQEYNSSWMIEQFSQLRSVDQSDPYLSSAAAAAFIKAGMFDDAQHILDTASNTAQKSAPWFGVYGLLAEARNDIEAARQYFQEAASIAEKSEPTAVEQWIVRLNALAPE